MKWEISKDDAFPVLKFDLKKGETVKSQGGSMMAMSEALSLKGKVDGGIGKAIGRMFSGETFFIQHIEAEEKAGWVLLASAMPGGITDIDIKEGSGITVQKSGFLAGTPDIDVSTKVQGLIKGIFGGEGLFVVKIGGSGTAFLQTYGAVHMIEVKAGEEVVVDNGYLIAWDSEMEYEITKGASSWVSAFTTGSGFVCKFKGPGRIWTQTRSPTGLASWLIQYLPKPSKKSSD